MGKNRKVRLEEEQQFIQYRLSFLPQVRQEIEAYIHQFPEQAASPNIAKGIDHLAKAEAFYRENNLSAAYGEFFWAKVLMRKGMLEFYAVRALNAYGQPGSNESSAETGKWFAWIEPGFHLPAVLSVVQAEEQIVGTFGVGLSGETTAVKVITVQFPVDWQDPVESILRNPDLFRGTNGLSQDGIRYEVKVSQGDKRANIDFGNPDSGAFLDLENALYDTAGQMASQSGDREVIDYLPKNWLHYLRRFRGLPYSSSPDSTI